MPDSPPAPRPARKSRPIRRVHKPRLGARLPPASRNLLAGVAFTCSVMVLAAAAYMMQGWSFRDAVYMVITTVFTVGYEEVRPIDTPGLNAITLTLVVVGCTSIIFLTGALVQYISFNQQGAGHRRMTQQIEDLSGHVVVCGFGRLGVELARALQASSAAFVVLEADAARAADAVNRGYLCIHGDATSETLLRSAGITQAHALATVLSNDALNVFITLSARALNPELAIVARGERASTESKLLQAGADKVVLPTHIGAERIAELLLYEESARIIDSLERSHGLRRMLRTFGMELETVTAAPQSAAVRMSVAAVERQAKGAFFIVQINRQDGQVLNAPGQEVLVGEGDGVVLMGRPNRAALLTSLFETRHKLGPRG